MWLQAIAQEFNVSQGKFEEVTNGPRNRALKALEKLKINYLEKVFFLSR